MAASDTDTFKHGSAASGSSGSIKAIDGSSVHRITSGQVVIDLQTAVKELVENSLDAGATSIEIRFKNHGLRSIEVVDNGSGIAESDFDSIGRKHHTSKLSAFHDLTTLTSFGFRGEALSSLCALCESVTVTTATADRAPMGAVLELDKRGEVKTRGKGVRQRGTSILLTSPFMPLPVRRKELERNIKREFGKALALLNAYALGPCCGLGPDGKGVRFQVTNIPDKGTKTTHISLPLPSNGSALSLRTVRTGATALWGPKACDGVIDLNLEFEVPKITTRKIKVKNRKSEEEPDSHEETFKICVKGLISSPVPVPGSGSSSRSTGSSRTATDRQFFYVNGRPCTLNKVQKIINDTYRTFLPSNSTSGQFPLIVADFTIPGDAVDVNVTPDKRTVLVHAEAEVCNLMKTTLEELFSPSRSTYGVNGALTKSAVAEGAFSRQGTLALAARSTSSNPSQSTSRIEDDMNDERPAMSTAQSSTVKEASTNSGMLAVACSPSIPTTTSLATRASSSPVQIRSKSRTESELGPSRHASLQKGSSEDRMDVDDFSPSSPPRSLNNGSDAIALWNPTSRPFSRHSSPEMGKSRALGEGKGSPQVVVLNTNGASWNRLRNSFGHPVDDSPTDTDADPDKVRNGPVPDHEKDPEPPRKKRRSELPPQEEEDELEEEEDQLELEEQSNTGRTKGMGTNENKGKTRAPSSKASVSTASSKTSKPTSTRQMKLTEAFTGKTSRQELRSRLVGFARSGSQVTHKSDTEEEEEQEERMDTERDGKDEADRSLSLAVSQKHDTSREGPEPLFLPDEADADADSMVVDNSDDLLTSSSSVLETSASSSVSVSTSATAPPESSSLVGSGINSVSGNSSERLDLTLDDDEDSSPLLLGSQSPDQSKPQNDPLHRPEVIRTQSAGGDVRLRFDISGISARWKTLHERLRDAKSKEASHQDRQSLAQKKKASSLAEEAGVSTEDAEASEAALSRVIDKADFGKMEVLGQFNLGFIVVRRRKSDEGSESEGFDDLFIVDQHAADEKYNFETLQQTTSIKSQKLFKPRHLELSASDELVALENLSVLKQNGFELEVEGDVHDEDDGDIEIVETVAGNENDTSHSGIRRKLKLIAQPVSKSTVFDMRDLQELIQLMHDRPTGQMVRCSKARAMFAMRACRKSVMVGMPLTKSQMSTVVTHMGTMDQPWNCPHGRPTMRHLFDMSNMRPSTQDDRACRGIDWAEFSR